MTWLIVPPSSRETKKSKRECGKLKQSAPSNGRAMQHVFYRKIRDVELVRMLPEGHHLDVDTTGFEFACELQSFGYATRDA
jgi:hypothetical protein